jgi:hypothetical protein
MERPNPLFGWQLGLSNLLSSWTSLSGIGLSEPTHEPTQTHEQEEIWPVQLSEFSD